MQEKGKEKLLKNSEIYTKALDLFVKNGYDATSMSQIAETLGMSKANLYYYCSSKENLLYQIHLDFLNNRFLPILEKAEGIRDPAERIAYFLKEFTLLNTSSRANRILVHEVHRLDRNHQSEILEIWKRAYRLIRDSIKELQRAGRINKKFRESFLTFMWAGMAFWVVYWFDYSRQTNAEELANTIAQTFLSTLAPAPNNETK
jgi:AcrR family transcriptional regulator